METNEITKLLKNDLDLLKEVLTGVKDSVSVEVSKDKYNEWNVEICDVGDVIVGDNNTVLLVVEAHL